MKYFALLLVFCAYSGLHFLTVGGRDFNSISGLPGLFQSSQATPDSLLKSDSLSTPNKSKYQNTTLPASYVISAVFNDSTMELSVTQQIIWRNTGSVSTNEMYFHFYPNAYQHQSLYLDGELPSEQFLTRIAIDSFLINGSKTVVQFVNTDALSTTDSTVGKISLSKAAAPGDSVIIKCGYRYQLPRAYGRMGYSPNKDYLFFSQWYIKPGVFENGKWICSPAFPHAEFFSDFADFQVTLLVPESFQVHASAAKNSVKVYNKHYRKHFFSIRNAHDFAWFAAKRFHTEQFTYIGLGGKKVIFSIIVPDAYQDLIPRYSATLRSAAYFCESVLGSFPYNSFTLSVTPQNAGRIGSMEYPGMATISHSPLTFSSSLEIERLIVHEFAHQYFYGAVANNETYEGWLDEGLASYLTSCMLDMNGLKDISSFKLFGQFPVQGLELLNMGEIPLIYTLTKIQVPNQADAMRSYYRHASDAALSDSSYLLSSASLYTAITYGKAELFFKTLEKILGRQRFLGMLGKFYQTYKFKHVNAKQFFSFLQAQGSRNLSWYIKNYYDESFVSDYSVQTVEYLPKSKECKVGIKRNGEAFFPCEVSLITENDTITRTVNNNRRFFTTYLRTDKQPIGVEIDLHRKNYFDVNFANNSKMLKTQYAATTYFSMRWFFWMQNLLLVFGSLA